MANTKVTGELIADNAIKAVHIDETATGVTLADLSVTGGLTVDTNTLVVDAVNNQVGIGTSIVTSGVKLQVQSSGGTILQIKDTTSGAGDYSNIWLGDESLDYAGFLGYNHESDAMTFGTTGSERMRIDSSGNVGIGKSNPSSVGYGKRLWISSVSGGEPEGQIYLEGNRSLAGQNVGAITFVNNGGFISGISGMTDDPNISNSGALTFFNWSNGTYKETMRIKSSGNVGINNSGAFAKLTVDLDGNSNGDVIDWSSNQVVFNRGGSSRSHGIGFSIDLSAGTSTISSLTPAISWRDLHFRVKDFVVYINGGTEKMRLTSNGLFYAYSIGAGGATTDLNYNLSTGEIYYVTSSARYKENIQELQEPILSKIKNIKVKTFDYIDKEEFKGQVGLIAEEVNEQLPFLVNKREIEGYDEPQPDSVKYSMLSVYLLKAIQEQQEVINDLKARIETLEAK